VADGKKLIIQGRKHYYRPESRQNISGLILPEKQESMLSEISLRRELIPKKKVSVKEMRNG